MGRVDAQINWNVWNAFVTTGHTIRLIFDFFSDLIKAWELFAFNVKELAIFCNEWKAVLFMNTPLVILTLLTHR